MHKKSLLPAICVLVLFIFFNTSLAVEYYSHGDKKKNSIAITVDDCFDKAVMESFIDTANEHGVKLTFFIMGKNIKKEDNKLLLKLLNNGNEIGNHSFSHRNMKEWTSIEIATELNKFKKALDKALNFKYKPNILRFPYGIGNYYPSYANYIKGASLAGYNRFIHWNVILDKPEKMLKRISNGSIILFHSNKKDYRAFKQILPDLTKANYKMLTVSELLGFEPVDYNINKELVIQK